jgi:hypothetical protein
MVVTAVVLREVVRGEHLLTTSGNHDLDGPGPHGEQIPSWLRRVTRHRIHVDRAVFDLDSTRFTLCPWWDGPVTKLEVDAQFARDALDRPDRWIWLYHSPPRARVCAGRAPREFPDHDLATWIERWQPDLVFTGHIHQAPWVDGGAGRRGSVALGSSTPVVKRAAAAARASSTPTPRRRIGSACPSSVTSRSTRDTPANRSVVGIGFAGRAWPDRLGMMMDRAR